MKNSYLILFCLFTFMLQPATGQSVDKKPPLFALDEVFHIKLTAGIQDIITDTLEEPLEKPGVLSYIDQRGEEVIIPVHVRARGNFRRRPDNCNFPPLKLYLNEDHVANTFFEGQDELKLVTHCMTGRSEYEQFLFQEYLVYRLYNMFTPYSFQVRLVEITYIEEGNPEDRITSYAFFLERPKHMASRNGGRKMDVENFRKSEVDSEVFRVLAVFQYMIANHDWFVSRLHNVELVTVDPLRPPIPVPYDFDWAGIVEAPYRYSMRSDTLENNSHDRQFMGICGKRKEFINVFNIFQEKRDNIFSLYQDFELLDLEQKGRSVVSLSEFFDFIDRPNNAIQVLRRDCNPNAVVFQ